MTQPKLEVRAAQAVMRQQRQTQHAAGEMVAGKVDAAYTPTPHTCGTCKLAKWHESRETSKEGGKYPLASCQWHDLNRDKFPTLPPSVTLGYWMMREHNGEDCPYYEEVI